MKRWHQAALALVALVLLGVGLRDRSSAPPSKRVPGMAAPSSTAPRETGLGNRMPPALVTPAPEPPKLRASLDRDAVCAGEEAVLTIEATGDDPEFFAYAVGTSRGPRIPIRAWPRQGGPPRPIEVIVSGRAGVRSTIAVQPPRLRDCSVDALVNLSLRPVANAPDRLRFVAEVVDRSHRFRPVAYHWDFDHGSFERTRVPTIEHDFADRSRDHMESYFLVSVDVLGEDGTRVRGRLPVAFPNEEFERFQNGGVVVLRASPSPRFAVLGSDGIVRQTMKLSHAWPDPVHIDEVWIRTTRASEAARSKPEVGVQGDPTEVLGVPEIGPDGLRVDLSIDTRAEPDAYMVSYSLRGRTREGWPVIGHFEILRPQALPTRGTADRIYDRELTLKILRAREILGQPYVTEEDLARLNLEGAFADIQASSRPRGPRSSWERQPVLR